MLPKQPVNIMNSIYNSDIHNEINIYRSFLIKHEHLRNLTELPIPDTNLFCFSIDPRLFEKFDRKDFLIHVNPNEIGFTQSDIHLFINKSQTLSKQYNPTFCKFYPSAYENQFLNLLLFHNYHIIYERYNYMSIQHTEFMKSVRPLYDAVVRNLTMDTNQLIHLIKLDISKLNLSITKILLLAKKIEIHIMLLISNIISYDFYLKHYDNVNKSLFKEMIEIQNNIISTYYYINIVLIKSNNLSNNFETYDQLFSFLLNYIGQYIFFTNNMMSYIMPNKL